jgi:small subunit ribosomal protein S9
VIGDDERRQGEDQPEGEPKGTPGGTEETTPTGDVEQGPPADAETPEPESEEPSASGPEAEGPAASDPEAEAPSAPEDETTSKEESPEESEAPEPEAPKPEPRSEPKTEDSEDRKKPPGAELEPIAIEPERELSAEERARLEAEAEERARREAEATAEAGEEPAPAREPAVELPADARIQATGKRKTSIARVILRAGAGDFEINRRSLQEYFPRHQHQTLVRQPLVASGYEGKVDVRVRVQGGGIAGQAGAVRHGIARALTEVDGELRGELKRRGLLTRDARAKERRKAGLKKARKRPQFSKR